MNTRDIVKEYLIANGYDGLYADECGCTAEFIMPCFGEEFHQCKPGYKIPCDPETCVASGDCDFHIGPKPKRTLLVFEGDEIELHPPEKP